MKLTLPAFKLIIFMLICGLQTYAQPVITSNTVVGLGESAPVRFALGNFTPGTAGANVNHDFSQLQDDNMAFSWEALSPAATAFSDSFPGATLAFRTPVQMGSQESWVYYDWNATSQTLDFLGSAVVLQGATQDTFFYVLTPDPKRVQTFPFTYGDSYTDSFNGRSTVTFGTFQVVQTRTGTITVEADAYGQLSTPAGTFQNVLRIKTTEQITDTYLTSVTTQNITRYSWYSSDEKYLLLHMDSIVVQPAQGPANTSISIFYRDGSPTVALEDALVALGYRPNDARAAVDRILTEQSDPVELGTEEIVRMALKNFGKQRA